MNNLDINHKSKIKEITDEIILKKSDNSKIEFELIQEKFYGDFENNIDKYKKIYNNEKIIFLINNFHISLKELFDIKHNKIELIISSNDIVDKILLEIHNICILYILSFKEISFENLRNCSLLNYYTHHQLDQKSLF